MRVKHLLRFLLDLCNGVETVTFELDLHLWEEGEARGSQICEFIGFHDVGEKPEKNNIMKANDVSVFWFLTNIMEANHVDKGKGLAEGPNVDSLVVVGLNWDLLYTGPEDIGEMQRARDAKSFRVVLCLCPPERTEKRAEPRASIRVIGTNRVTVDTGRSYTNKVKEEKQNAEVEIICFTSKYISTFRIEEAILNVTLSAPEAPHCRIRVSSYHISNEKIYDLLEPQVSEVCRFHDTEEAVLLEGLRELEVGSAQELLDVYNSGIAHRNAGVSRGDFASKSHMVLNIMVINMRGKLDKETMSCLQFAAQALNVPSRTIHTSQIRYSPSQSQASLPSIMSSPGPLSQLKPKRSLEVSESCSFLPHLEKSRPPESSGYHSCGSRITDEKSGAVDVRVMKSAIPLSRCGSVFVEPLHRHSAEKPSSSHGSSSIPPLLPECSNCKQERKIREEYDKFIIQVKRDRDSLSQRVTELEKELKNRGGEQIESRKVEKDKRGEERDVGRQETPTGSNETENEGKTDGKVRKITREGGEGEIGNDKSEKEENDIRRHYRGTKREEESQRREKSEEEKENDSAGKESIYPTHGATEVPKNTEESLGSDLHSLRKENEGLRKSVDLSITQLHKEKAELLSHIEDTKNCYEKVCALIHIRREHSLLLDVMLVLYKRAWFLQDAMPYVRRTLKKCGLTLDDSD
ncbi:kinesin-like protein KIN-10C [Silurus asotus]|uniref:Kinesin-like protein KIN-10C n=1 Tax=Silurus asotus TaxID=30991 RepID=A0AAD5AVK0_SILAS|nr:kinesin-like protein KIN-10C [Silurus asotus]